MNRRKLLGLALIGVLAASSTPAYADYVFDSSDLPADFACNEDRTAEQCEADRRFEAWHTRYGDSFDRWFDALLFDTSLYFREPSGATEPDDWRADSNLTPNLVDAVYSIALRRYSGWAFAVDDSCPRIGQPGECRPVLRMVSRKSTNSPFPDWLRNFLPTSRDDLVREIEVTFDWREADLRSCKPAMKLLRAFPKRIREIWPKGYLDSLDGESSREFDEFIIVADGDGVFLRAAGRDNPEDPHLRSDERSYVASQANGGEAYSWALDMYDAVQPCLGLSIAPPPWRTSLLLPDQPDVQRDSE